MRLLLDTSVLIAMMRGRPPSLATRISRLPLADRVTSAITIGELLAGAEKSRDGAREREFVERRIISQVPILPFDVGAARVYARVRAELERVGKRLDDPDLRIAAIALTNNLTLITGDVKHFERVPGLRVENWLE